MMVPRILAVMAILAVPACGGDDDSTPANAGGSHSGASNAGGGAKTGGRATTAGLGPGGAGGANAGAATSGGRPATGGTSPVGGGGGTGGGVGQTCINCGIANCATSALACYANADCQAILTCAVSASCQDLACIDTCASQYPAGQTALAPVVTCMQTNCAAQCGLA